MGSEMCLRDSSSAPPHRDRQVSPLGIGGEMNAPQAPRVGAHDVILTGLDEESDSTNEEMPPLEPLEPREGAAQLGEVWLCGHERRM